MDDLKEIKTLKFIKSNKLKPELPPTFSIQDLFPKSCSSKFPNAFIVYRKQLCQNLKALNISINMPIVSSLASKLWNEETDEFKTKYKTFIDEAKSYYQRQCSEKTDAKVNPYIDTVSFNDAQENFEVYNYQFQTNDSQNIQQIQESLEPLVYSQDYFYWNYASDNLIYQLYPIPIHQCCGGYCENCSTNAIVNINRNEYGMDGTYCRL
ncbi:21379_t:CDS:1 [Dentiscutata erythropus]|uniref:21379_t:CDS:1 n=1 Tax=Dentiscutata erythropus TaxID=1348616 RepID=A0A9N9JNY0_9GLOM|nr:21379_t:CDS:1 [Dentiscutata erythropus]